MARIGAVLIVLAAAGCGGGGAADAPKLPHALGVSLAAQASAVSGSSQFEPASDCQRWSGE